MKSVKILIVAMLVLVASLSSVFAGNGCNPGVDPVCTPTPVDKCDVTGNLVLNPGTFNLASGIDICLNNTTLDCGGANFYGPGSALGTSGISLKNVQGNTIINCSITNYKVGIDLISSNLNAFINNSATSNYQGVSLSGNSNILTGNIINSNSNYAIYLNSSSDNTLSFNTANYGSIGIILYLSNGNTIKGNIANSNYNHGMLLYSSSNNALINNVANLNYNGFYLDSSSQNTLSSNTANSNFDNGIYFGGSSQNTLSSNTANSNYNHGIYLESSPNNTLSSNTANSNYIGTFLYSSSDFNTLTSNTINSNANLGIYLDSSSQNILINNAVSSNSYGIYLFSTSNSNILNGNVVNSNNYGISLFLASNNIISFNTATSNAYGIFLSSSNSNLIYNNFFNNTINAQDSGINFWNTTKNCSQPDIIGGPCIGGNFWGDYSGYDIDSDGIGDTNLPYTSNGNILNGGDFLPLVLTQLPQPPVLDGIPDQTLFEDSGFNGNLVNLTQYVSDLDNDTSQLSFSIVSESNEGVVDCDITLQTFIDCATQTNQFGNSTIVVMASDGQFNDTDDFDIIVLPVNDPPSLAGLPSISPYKNSGSNQNLVNLTQYAQDVDNSLNQLSFSIFSQTNPSVVNCVIDSNKNVDCAVTFGLSGSSNVTVMVSDGSLFVTSSFLVTVINNSQPSFSSAPPPGGMVNSLYTYQASAFDWDLDPLTFSLLSGPQGMMITSTGLLTWIPLISGKYNVSISVSDPFGATDLQHLVVKICGKTKVVPWSSGNVSAIPCQV